MLSKKTFDFGMVRLANFFKKDNPSKQFTDDYYEVIKDKCSDESFQKAVNWLIGNHAKPYFPIPFEFCQAVEAVRDRVAITEHRYRIEEKKEGTPCPPEVKKMMERFKPREMP